MATGLAQRAATVSATPGQPANAVVIPGPSKRTEGLTRVAVDAMRNAIAGLQGAADAVRSLGR